NCTASDNIIKRRKLAEVESWITDRDAHGPFSFETISEALGVDADYLRIGIREWVEQLSGTHPHRQVRHEHNGRMGKIGSPVRRRRRRRAKTAALWAGATGLTIRVFVKTRRFRRGC